MDNKDKEACNPLVMVSKKEPFNPLVTVSKKKPFNPLMFDENKKNCGDRNCFKAEIKEYIDFGMKEDMSSIANKDQKYYKDVGYGKRLISNSEPINPIIIERSDKRFVKNEKGELCFVGNGYEQPICNFIVYPIAEVTEDDGNITTKKYLLRGKLNGDKDLHQISITAGEFRVPDWIYKKWGIKCKLYAAAGAYKFIQEYISEQMLDVPKRYQYNHIGWRWIEGRHVYLHGGGAIGADDYNLSGNREYTLEINNELSEQLAFKRLLDMLNIVKFNVSIPLMTYTILGILNKPFQDAGFEPKFIMFLNGTTGTRKTTLSKMFCNLFNREKNIIPASFKDTMASLEVKSFEHKDCVLFVDDFHPSTDKVEKRHMENIASYLMRIYGDKIPKSRMNKNMQKQKEFKPRGLCLITGEDIIGGSSTTARYINVEINKNDVNLQKLTEHQREMTSFSTALAYFIKRISNNYDVIVNHIKKDCIRLRYEFQDNFSHGRIVESFILLKIAFDLLLNYGEDIKIFNNKETEAWSKVAHDIFWQLASKHDESMITQDPGIMYLIAIKELAESGKVKIIEIEKSKVQNRNGIGYIGEGKLYLLPQITFNEVKQFWIKQGKEFPLSLQKTNEALDNLGVIETKYEGKKLVRTIKVSIGDSRSRYLIIDTDKMNQVLLANE